jgi:ankyrin repeat protein
MSSVHPNRVSVQSTTSSNGGRSILNHANVPIITEDQVIRALQERPAQDGVLQIYLAQRGDPNIVDGNGNSLLHLAIIAHSQASVVFLVNAPDIRLEHGSPISPLYTAVRFRSWKAAQQLIIQGADVNAHDERGVSVLHVVLLFMTKGDTLAEEVVQLLCDNKADVNCVANDKKSIPLLIAVERELWAEVEILMAFGANPYMIWGRDRRQSMGLGQAEGTGANGVLTTGYFNDPLWEAVNDDKVHLVRLLLKFYYAPTSFSATSSSPSPSPSSTQSSQSFFGPQHPFVHHSSASSYTTNNGSSGNINIPNLPHGGSVPMPFANNGGHGTPPSIPSPCSAQSSPGSSALHGYMGHRNNAADTVGSPKLTAIQGGSGHVGSFTNASANANMIGGANPIYVITPKVLLQALTLAKDLGHHDCLQILSRPEVTLKEGTLYGTGSFGYNNQLNGQLNGPIGGYGHGHGGGMGKEHRNILQKFTSLFK